MKRTLRAAVALLFTEDLWWKTSSPTHTGWIHEGCKDFADPEAMVSKGPISKIVVYRGDFIHATRLWYGSDGLGGLLGFAEGIPSTEWKVPDGERITRVEGDIAGYDLSRPQFFTDGGQDDDTDLRAVIRTDDRRKSVGRSGCKTAGAERRCRSVLADHCHGEVRAVILEVERRDGVVVGLGKGTATDDGRCQFDVEEVPREHSVHLHGRLVRGDEGQHQEGSQSAGSLRGCPCR